MGISTINAWYGEFSKIVGKDFYIHNLRHNFCTRLLRAGIPAMVVKDIIGWSDLSLVDGYNDQESEESFAQYFGAEGIKTVEQKSLSDL